MPGAEASSVTPSRGPPGGSHYERRARVVEAESARFLSRQFRRCAPGSALAGRSVPAASGRRHASAPRASGHCVAEPPPGFERRAFRCSEVCKVASLFALVGRSRFARRPVVDLDRSCGTYATEPGVGPIQARFGVFWGPTQLAGHAVRSAFAGHAFVGLSLLSPFAAAETARCAEQANDYPGVSALGSRCAGRCAGHLRPFACAHVRCRATASRWLAPESTPHLLHPVRFNVGRN